MGLWKSFKTDPELEQRGVWLDYGDFRVRIARAGGTNKGYMKAVEAKTAQLRRAIQHGVIDITRTNAILREVYAEHVVLAWETKRDGHWVSGIEDYSEGQSLLPVTAENLNFIFKELPDIFSDIQEQATQLGLFLEHVNEEDAKNL